MGVNMIKPEDKFRSFCGSSFSFYTLITLEKHRTQKFQWGKNCFYISMYDKNSIYNTTYYAE